MKVNANGIELKYNYNSTEKVLKISLGPKDCVQSLHTHFSHSAYFSISGGIFFKLHHYYFPEKDEVHIVVTKTPEDRNADEETLHAGIGETKCLNQHNFQGFLQYSLLIMEKSAKTASPGNKESDVGFDLMEKQTICNDCIKLEKRPFILEPKCLCKQCMEQKDSETFATKMKAKITHFFSWIPWICSLLKKLFCCNFGNGKTADQRSC
jgi:hypothetical protein